MDNYEYIIASLPVITTDVKASENLDPEQIKEWILSQCSDTDKGLVNLLYEGFDDGKLDKTFYDKALSCSNRFIREYFTFDLAVRNSKVAFLNKALGRPAGTDIFMQAPEVEESQKIESVLSQNDILGRERGLDDLMWDKINLLNTFDYFNIDAVLGFLSKMHIVDRWLKLDDAKGREMFRTLVSEVRGTFKGVEFNS